jgi:hypothetical protein
MCDNLALLHKLCVMSCFSLQLWSFCTWLHQLKHQNGLPEFSSRERGKNNWSTDFGHATHNQDLSMDPQAPTLYGTIRIMTKLAPFASLDLALVLNLKDSLGL